MSTPPRARRIAERYRERAAALRAAVDARLQALYGDELDPDAIAESFQRFVERADPLIAAGQASMAVMAAAFVRSVGLDAGDFAEVDPIADTIAGTTRGGMSLAEGMAAIGPMLLAAIRDGRPVDDAIAGGASLVSRFSDAEITGAADRELENEGQVLGPLSGWEGIVAPDACDPCQENAGVHELDWVPYRHAWCQCTQVPVFG